MEGSREFAASDDVFINGWGQTPSAAAGDIRV
jgi:hypothetical protein